MVQSEFSINNMKVWIHSALYSSGWGWWCNGVGDIFLAYFGQLTTNQANQCVEQIFSLTNFFHLLKGGNDQS